MKFFSLFAIAAVAQAVRITQSETEDRFRPNPTRDQIVAAWNSISRQDVINAFNAIDTNDNGTISKAEAVAAIKHVAAAHDYTVGPGEWAWIQATFNEHYPNATGVTLPQLATELRRIKAHFLEQYPALAEEDEDRFRPNPTRAEIVAAWNSISRQDVIDAFHRIDTNDNGTISKAEAVAAIKHVAAAHDYTVGPGEWAWLQATFNEHYPNATGVTLPQLANELRRIKEHFLRVHPALAEEDEEDLAEESEEWKPSAKQIARVVAFWKSTSRQDVINAFNAVDTNDNGLISRQEAVNAVKHVAAAHDFALTEARVNWVRNQVNEQFPNALANARPISLGDLENILKAIKSKWENRQK